MSTYTAPLKDMQFAIKELAGLSEVSALPGYGEVNAELVDAVLGEAAKFAQEVLDPLNREGDKQGAQLADGKVTAPRGFKEAYRKFIEAGWNGLGGQPEYGGQGLPHLIATPVQEIWKSANMALCLCPDAHLGRARGAEGPRLAGAAEDLLPASSPRASGPAP